MKREEFEIKYEQASNSLDNQEMIYQIKRTMDENPLYIGKTGTRNLVIVNEELAELQQQISKFLRGKEDHIGLVEEIADVLMGIEYLKLICDITDEEINKACNVKLDRLKETEAVYK